MTMTLRVGVRDGLLWSVMQRPYDKTNRCRISWSSGSDANVPSRGSMTNDIA